MMTTFQPRRTQPSSSSASDAAGEARSLPRPRLEDDPREASAPDPVAAMLSLAAARSHWRAPSWGRSRTAAQAGRALLQVPTRGEAHDDVSQGESDQGSDDDESVVLLPPPPFHDHALQRAIDETFDEAQQAGQRGRSVGGARHDMMEEAIT